MKNTRQLPYPDINEALIKGQNRIDICNLYSSALRSTNDFYHNQYAYKLDEYVDAENNKPLLQMEYDSLVSFIDEWSAKHNVQVDIIVRLKDWLGYNAKIRLFLSKGRCVDSIKDLLGFKLVLKTQYPDTVESHKLCYKLTNDVLNFLVLQRHCLLLQAEAKSGSPLSPLSSIAKKLFIYDKNEIEPKFVPFVKNYLAIPKNDGYQGLHCYVKTPSKLVFEIQVHTTATNMHAEELHETYKDVRYENIDFDIDFDKIHIPGLVFDECGKIRYDSTGLFKPDFKFLCR
mgnify:CR=1 FL=1